MVLSSLRAYSYQPVGRIDIGYFEATEFLTAEGRVITQRQHHAVTDRLLPCCLDHSAPFIIIRNPGQLSMMRNKAPFTPTAKPPPGCVAASANWVAGSDAFFYQVIVVEADRSESLMNGRVGQSYSRTCGLDPSSVRLRS
jgi:hypothetical protein